jgi:hypothetical protein
MKVNVREWIKSYYGCFVCKFKFTVCGPCHVQDYYKWEPPPEMEEIIRLAEAQQATEAQQEIVKCVICGEEDTREMLATCEVCDTGPQCREHGVEHHDIWECQTCLESPMMKEPTKEKPNG